MWTGSDDVAAFRGDGDYTHCLVVTAKFSQQIKIILTGVRVAGDKYHHQRFVIDQRFWSMTESGWRIIKGRQFTRRQSQSFYGDQAEQSLQNYHFDMLFLGVDAIDLERGVSTHNEDEARLNRRMCEVAERIIVVTDSSKFNRSSLHKIIDTQRIDMIIVDEGIPADSLEGLRKAGVEVILVGE